MGGSWSRRDWLRAAAAAPLVEGGLRRAAPAHGAIVADDVQQAIDGGRTFLKRYQQPEGSWPGHSGEHGGMTALCLLALVNSGEPLDSPAVLKALRFLRTIETSQRTYSKSLRIMALAAIGDAQDLGLMQRDAQWLQQAQIASGSRSGAWAYSSGLGRGDNSNSQFALLALHEAEQSGVAVDMEVWRRAHAYWQQEQHPANGSWTYYQDAPKPIPPTGSMTCAGIASLVITSSKLRDADSKIVAGDVQCCGAGNDDAERVERGLQFLGSPGFFTLEFNPGSPHGAYWLYYLYALERVGRLTGRRFIGQRDWYREGAELLVRRAEPQATGLSWRGTGPTEQNRVLSTAFALLFLSKGRRPVLLAKLRHGADPRDWDRHRSAIDNLVKRIEQSWRRRKLIDTYLTWQVIDSRASASDLLESPLLFLSGTQPLQLSGEEKLSLQRYVLQGGFVYAEACDGDGCNGAAFADSFRALAGELFPESPLRVLPEDHPIWFADQKVDYSALPQQGLTLEGVEACCRTSVVLCNRSLSCYWELAGRDVIAAPPRVQQEILASVQLAQNIVAYATNFQLKDKLRRPRDTARDDQADELRRATLVIPELAHEGGANEAPNALPNLAREVRRQLEMRVLTRAELVSATDSELPDYPFLFAHGRRSFRFGDAERAALRKYLENGGFLFVNAICASAPFAASVRAELHSILPEAAPQPIGPRHPLLTTRFQGAALGQVTIRRPRGRQGAGPAAPQQAAPVLEAWELDGRICAVFSPLDISCALQEQTSAECEGYVRDDAFRISINVLLFALQN